MRSVGVEIGCEERGNGKWFSCRGRTSFSHRISVVKWKMSVMRKKIQTAAADQSSLNGEGFASKTNRTYLTETRAHLRSCEITETAIHVKLKTKRFLIRNALWVTNSAAHLCHKIHGEQIGMQMFCNALAVSVICLYWNWIFVSSRRASQRQLRYYFTLCNHRTIK